LILVPISICDLTCKGNDKSRACEWQCKLYKHETGQCQDRRCVCQGQIDEDEDIFEDVTDEEKTVEGLPYFLKQAIFLPLSRSYIFRARENLLNPTYYGIQNAENFYISTSDGGVLGAWFIWPDSSVSKTEEMNEKNKLIVYMHGNSLDRGFSYRIELYKVLTKLGYHIIAFDYR